MKGISYRMWVLMLGIAVALVIAMAAFLFKSKLSSSFSVIPRPERPLSSSAPFVLLKEAVEKTDGNKSLSK